MIGSSFMNSSSWGSDKIVTDEFSLGSYLGIDESPLDLNLFDNSVGNWEEHSSIYSGSPVYSSTSEESDFSQLDDNNILPITDSLASKFLEEESIIDSIDLNDFDWETISSTYHHDPASSTETTRDNVFDTTDRPRKKQKCTKSTKPSSKSWTKMNQDEKYRTALSLSKIISRIMDYRKQMAVIKLIEPNVKLHPTATEFDMKVSRLNDAKLTRILNFLKENTIVSDLNSLIKPTKVKSSNSSNCHRAKRKPKLQQCQDITYVSDVARDKKVMRQGKKEQKSGLFVKEKIIKLVNPQEEEEDVNILE